MWAVVLAVLALAWARPALADCASIDECQDEVIRQTAEREIAARRVKVWIRETAVAATLTAQPSPTIAPSSTPQPTLTAQPSPTLMPTLTPTLMPTLSPTLTSPQPIEGRNEGSGSVALRVVAVVVCALGLIGVVAWMVKRG